MCLVATAPRPPSALDLGVAALRRHQPGDAEGLAAAVGASMQDLLPWMPWASAEAAEPSFQRRRLEELGARWEGGSEFSYAVLAPSGEVIGSIGLHDRIGPGALEIGYWLHTAHLGRGIATAAAGALTEAALGLPKVTRVEIHCDQANTRSWRIPERLGYRLDRLVDDAPVAPGECGKLMVWLFDG